MSQTPQVSVIIPFRDRPKLTLACLQSLVGHLENLRFEILLVDNGSSAETIAKIRDFKELPTEIFREDIPFNFQALNNRAASRARGDVLVLLNNDIILDSHSKGFFERVFEEAKKPEVGAVGCLLTYPDGTVQHAGVVVGMNTFADHLYRGWSLEQAKRFPFSSPTTDRWVSAVTAACLAVEKRKFDQIGGMDEAFIVCGGDVDLCLRLAMAGYRNLYLGSVSMIHAESKSRDPGKIPASDFSESERSYQGYLRAHGGRDPYYPEPLPLNQHAGFPPHSESRSDPSTGLSLVPPENRFSLVGIKRIGSKLRSKLRVEPPELVVAKGLIKIRRKLFGEDQQRIRAFEQKIKPGDFGIPHMQPIRFHRLSDCNPAPRLNVLLPHYDAKGVFGGILTAACIGYLFKKRHPHCALRFVFTDGEGRVADIQESMAKFFGQEAYSVPFDVQFGFNRTNQSVSVHSRDLFVATAWWTAYSAQLIHQNSPFAYLVQDYEPCFYPWGEEFAAAYSTYKMNFLPLFNTSILQDYFGRTQLIAAEQMTKSVAFNPAINKALGERKPKAPGEKRVLLFYGRRTVARNLFGCGVQALERVVAKGLLKKDEWELLSAGEKHDPVDLGQGCFLRSVGKLGLDEYLKLLSRVDLGLSLMLSPHPSYPPLELAAAGAVTVTNRFENKDLSKYFARIESCDPNIQDVYEALKRALKRVSLGEADSALHEKSGSPFGHDWEAALVPAADALHSWLMELR